MCKIQDICCTLGLPRRADGNSCRHNTRPLKHQNANTSTFPQQSLFKRQAVEPAAQMEPNRGRSAAGAGDGAHMAHLGSNEFGKRAAKCLAVIDS